MSERTITTQDVGTEEELTLSQDAAGQLLVNDEPIWSVSALDDGIVALATNLRMVHISALDYWRLLYGDAGPSPRVAGMLAARLTHIECHATELIEEIVREARISPTAFPAIWERVAALRTALGATSASEVALAREAS
jgi:hypothetical protein